MVSVEIYIKVGDEFKRIDLFKDEKISLNSSIQNINDLSKVFTDFTQSFTIPASANNNIIFNYWNESAVSNGFDQRIRYDAIIELNTIPFKKGQIQIEKANEKDNRIESYSITFYGKVKQIKDLFKEDKLSVLDYSSLNHTYTSGEIEKRINGTNTDGALYPLVGNQHYYEYNNGGTYDITVGSSPDTSIVWTDLFPAISVSNIFNFIQTKYGITFTSSLFDTSYWTNLYLYCKNVEQLKAYTNPVRINFTSSVGYMQDLNLTTDELSINWVQSNGTTPTIIEQVILKITPANNTIPYRLKVKNAFSNNVLNVFENLLGYNEVTVLESQSLFNSQRWYFEIESELPLTFSTRLDIRKFASGPGSGSPYYEPGYATSPNQSTTSNINIKDYVPDIKVVDFFNGLIKMFNLTIVATSETSFNLEPLEFFYSYGKYTDINNYVINDSVDLERTKLFKKLLFSHEKSENVLNNFFRNTFNRGYDYGDLLYENDLSNESATYEIKSPFEDVMWDRILSSNFQTASLIDKDLKPYKPKPILMYKNNLQSVSPAIKLYDGAGSYININNYQRFSNELFLNNSIASLNFGDEQSSFNLSALASDSLFALWYRNYISALYNIKCRIVKLKAIIPITMLSDIKLNDKIIYKDKKYIINQFTTDLTTGEVDFELISDFRDVASKTTGNGKFALKDTFSINNTAQNLEVTILKLNSDNYDVEYLGYSNRTNTKDKTFIVPIDANTTGNIAFKQIEITYYSPNVKQYINIIQDA